MLDVEKKESCAMLVGSWIGAATMENSIEDTQNFKIELPYDPAITLLGIYSKTLTWKDISIPMFIAALLTIAKTQKQAKCPSIDE